MNHTNAYIQQTPGGAFLAMVRLPKDAKANPILEKGGKPKRFYDAYSAMQAASQCVCEFWNGHHLVRDGERLSAGNTDEIKRVFGGKGLG